MTARKLLEALLLAFVTTNQVGCTTTVEHSVGKNTSATNNLSDIAPNMYEPKKNVPEQRTLRIDSQSPSQQCNLYDYLADEFKQGAINNMRLMRGKENIVADAYKILYSRKFFDVYAMCPWNAGQSVPSKIRSLPRDLIGFEDRAAIAAITDSERAYFKVLFENVLAFEWHRRMTSATKINATECETAVYRFSANLANETMWIKDRNISDHLYNSAHDLVICITDSKGNSP